MDYFGSKSQKLPSVEGSAPRPSCLLRLGALIPDLRSS